MAKDKKKLLVAKEDKKLIYIAVLRTFCNELGKDSCEKCKLFPVCNKKECYMKDFNEWRYEDLEQGYQRVLARVEINFDKPKGYVSCEQCGVANF